MKFVLGKISSLGLRSRMLLFFGGGMAVVLLLIRMISLFGIPVLGVKGEYDLHTNKAVAEMQVLADQQKTLMSHWFTERLADLKFFSSSLPVKNGAEEAARLIDTNQNGPPELHDFLLNNTLLKGVLHQMEQVRSAYGLYGSIDLLNPASKLIVASTETSRVGTVLTSDDLKLPEGTLWDNHIAFVKMPDDLQTSLLFLSTVQAIDGKGVNGIVIFKISIETFLEQLLSIERSLGAGGEIILIDMFQTLLTPLRHSLPNGTIAKPLEYRLKTRSADFAAWGVDGIVEALDYRGVPVMSVVRHLRLASDFAVSMIVNLDQDVLYAPVRKSLVVSLGVLAIGLGSVILLVVIVARQLALPLEQLSKTALKIRTGDLSARSPEVGGDEVRELAQAFNDMADTVQESHENLEAQVAERTAALEANNRLLRIEIEERLEAEKKIRVSEERFRLAMDATNDGLWDWNVETGEMYFSPQYYRMLGYEADEFPAVIDSWYQLLHPDDRETAIAANNACINNETQQFNIEFRMKAKDGTWRTILGRGRAVLRRKDGSAIQMIGTHADITERKQLENQLMQSQKMESIGRLAGGIAHDFNNMLAVIFLSLEMAKTRLADDDPVHEQLNDIKKAARRSRDITRHLLTFSRKQVTSPQLCLLNDIYRSIETSLARLIGEDIELSFHPDGDLDYILIDPTQIDQVLVNLAINARDALPDGGKLTFETANVSFDADYCREHTDTKPGKYVKLSVTDNGVGMNPDTVENIFEPFFTTKDVGKGTGLGLAMIYGVVKQHNGFITVESVPGVGTSFNLYFPRVDAGVKPVAEVQDSLPVQKGVGKILLVEDDVTLCEMTQRMIETFGYTVTSARSPDEALLLFESGCQDFVLLLTDVVMPGMNGRQLAEIVTDKCPDIKVMFMSGYTSDAIVHRGVIEENVSFIQKPFRTKDLAAKIQEAIAH